MNDFLTDLYTFLLEDIQIPTGDPEYKQAVQAYLELEEEVKKKIGLDLLSQYQRAQHIAFGWENAAIFSCGLRFGAQFMLEVLKN